MDPTPSPEPTVEAQSKRRQPPYNGGEQQTNTSKKRKTTSEDEIRRVEEVILVMRGGRDPTMAEKSMISEAKTAIVSLCEDLSPKDILPYDYESFRVLIDDLGLSRLKEQFLGFCTLELSISERFHHAKRMEEKSYANQPASYPSQRLQNDEAAGDHHGTPSKVHVLDSKVPEHPSCTSSMDYMNRAVNCPFCKVTINGVESVLVCDTCEKGYHMGCLQSYNVKGVPRGEWHCPRCLSMNRENQFPPKYFRVTRNMYAPKAPSNATGVQPSSEKKVETVQPMRTQFTQRTNSGTKNNVWDHPVRTDGNVALNAPQKTALASTGPAVNPAAAQNTPVSIPAVHHPLQGVQAVHVSSPHNRHPEISKLVLKVLDSKVPEHPGWTSSMDYMNRAVNCPFCKVTINGVESVLVCDACEKGYHLGCLQSYNAKGVPRGEWHCPRCLAMNHGNQFPPKYGRVIRNMYVPSNVTGVQLSSEIKVETVGGKMNQPGPVTKVETVDVKVNQPSPVAKIETAEEKVNHPNPVGKVETAYEKVNQPSPVTNAIPGFRAHVPTSKLLPVKLLVSGLSKDGCHL